MKFYCRANGMLKDKCLLKFLQAFLSKGLKVFRSVCHCHRECAQCMKKGERDRKGECSLAAGYFCAVPRLV